MSWFGVASYAVAGGVSAAVTAMLVAGHPGGRSATWITAACAVAAIWGFGNSTLLMLGGPFAGFVALDVLHGTVWAASILSWVAPAPARRRSKTLLVASSLLFGTWSIVAAVAETGTAGLPRLGALYPVISSQSIFLPLLGINLIGLLGIEQVFRNAREEQRNGLRFLCLAVGGIFVLNVFVYSQASLVGRLIPFAWQGRGFLNAAFAVLVLLGLKRLSEWERELFVSRQVAFYTASLVAVGTYLLLMGAAGYVIRAVGGQWGVALQLIFLVAALAILVYALFASNIRARAKVFLVKHFYRNKYDYRQEWLRLTSALSRTGDTKLLAASGLEGVAGILGSRHGSLWIVGEDGRYEQVAWLDESDRTDAIYDPIHPIVVFLTTRGWVIDSEEYRLEPDRYGNAFGDPADGLLPRDTIIVPLDCQGRLQGFIVLSKPPEVDALNFEDHDILKTAGRQVAVVLAQALAQEQLTATRQFEAVNKLVTFLMHDLKNVVAQQELVVANAQRFGHRKEFVDDAMTTIRAGVERMRRVLDQLRDAAQSEPSRSRCDASKIIMEVRSRCADREPVPDVKMPEGSLWVNIDREKLASVLTHVIRNAQDATPADGRISIDVENDEGQVWIAVRDTGNGMDAAFVRDRLFRPFVSTKGAKGMGIGAYQVRETVRAVGGDVEVESEVGRGTTFRIRLPAGTPRAAETDLPAAARGVAAQQGATTRHR